jgi:steroid delta-isomerase
MTLHADPRLARVIDFYQRLAPADLARIGELYAPDAHFRDPFNEVQGTAAIARIFQHMFSALQQPRFEVASAIAQGDEAFLTWNFHFRRGQRDFRIHGGTRLLFDGSGRIALHRDYWDAAEELYAQLPLLGGLMRWLRRRLAG